MASTHKSLRSSTANKRPTTAIVDGQIAVNTNSASPGLFFKDSTGAAIIKIGPVHVGTTAPNATPGAGGSSGNSIGEQWLDTSNSRYVFKVWDGTAWRSEDGEFVNASGDTMTGALVMPAGAVTTPSITFTGDLNTGIYSPGADQIAISANGVQQFLVDSTNVSCKNLVLKANTPEGGELQLNNPTDTGVVYYFDANTATNARIFTVSNNTNLDIGQLGGTGGTIKFFTENTEKIRLASNGSICINTTDSTGKVNIAPTGSRSIGSSWDTSSVLIGTPGANSANLGLSFDATNGAVIETGTPGIVTYPIHLYGSILKFSAGGTERIRVSGTGAVGFGTTTPTTSIGFPIAQNTSIGAVAGTSHSSGNVGSITLGIQDGSGLSGITIYNTHDGTYSSQDIRFTTAEGGISATTERMKISSDGSLTVKVAGSTRLFIDNSNNGSAHFNCTGLAPSPTTGAPNAEGGIVHQLNGNTKVRGTSANNTLFQFFYYNNTTTSVGEIVVSSTATAYNTSSDYRLKENVVALTGASDRLNQLQPYRFNFITDTNKIVDGFLAHEAQNIVPECVTGEKDAVDDEGNPVYQGIDQSKLVPLLTAALQEALAEIGALKDRVAALEAQ